jgi:hypothetical protein
MIDRSRRAQVHPDRIFGREAVNPNKSFVVCFLYLHVPVFSKVYEGNPCGA